MGHAVQGVDAAGDAGARPQSGKNENVKIHPITFFKDRIIQWKHYLKNIF